MEHNSNFVSLNASRIYGNAVDVKVWKWRFLTPQQLQHTVCQPLSTKFSDFSLKTKPVKLKPWT